jgi:superfamily II DNA/RNA helicase
MASNIEELQANIEAAIEPGFRHKLLARGQSRGMIWREGILPDGAPHFSLELSGDLLSFGYSLLSHALRYADLGGDPGLARIAFRVAAEALEAVVAKGEVTTDRDFHRLAAAAAYHLGRYSAKAYSILNIGVAESNLSIIEKCLAKLMLRELDGLADDIANWFETGIGSDEVLIAAFALYAAAPGNASELDEEESDEYLLEPLAVALDGNFMAAMAIAMLSLERGDEALTLQAQERLTNGLDVAGELNLVSQWWCHRLAKKLLDGLWQTSFHKVLPQVGPPGADIGDWTLLRKLFISSLYRRKKAEVELWPSQLQAAERVLHFDASLVLSLPTSAGKTRIAELCILACLAQKKRVVFVTPLRALSAQTEVGLRRTFAPLGTTVSSLYGSIGTSGSDLDALRSSDIVVATPEKLDFALRNDPSLLDDIGLIVLDEGHMIGLGEREVRYEAQIQRLLRRQDADQRRIVCLSAILPDGDQLEDFAAWMTRDKLDGLIKDDWRPTRLRFGEVDWKGTYARLNVTVGEEKPFIPEFLVGKKPAKKSQGTQTFPSDQTELCIATAWRLMEDGQTVLVFCPLRASVLPFAKRIIKMHKRGHIGSVLSQPESVIAKALAVGTEWFGPDHEILACLKLGVAVHHGALPTPYRKEIECLLRDGILKLTVSSPTLAQGLNLAATSLVFHGLMRWGETIKVSEFRNVIGRAGRAYIDIEGLVLYPMYDDHAKRRLGWNELISNQKGLEMESGIVRLVFTLLLRMTKKLGHSDPDKFLQYLSGQSAWDFPVLANERTRVREVERNNWPLHLMSLDTAIFSLLSDTPVADDDVEDALDETLSSSLFHRRLARKTEKTQKLLTAGLVARAKYIWSHTTPLQRKGYFLAGVGLATGKELDKRAPELEQLLLTANMAIGHGDHDLAVEAITEIAEIAFSIPPFAPRNMLDNWKNVLRLWLLGQPITLLLEADSDEVISFIETAFVYNLPWAMEAVRVRAEAYEDPLSEELKLSDFSRAHAVSALETGTLSIAAAVLIQAGFASRLAAIRAIDETEADFDSMVGLRNWLSSEDVHSLSARPDWPTRESHQLWLDFIGTTTSAATKKWTATAYDGPVTWFGVPMPPGMPLRLGGGPGKERSVYSPDFTEVGRLKWTPNPDAKGIIVATATGAPDKLSFEYLGPGDLLSE